MSQEVCSCIDDVFTRRNLGEQKRAVVIHACPARRRGGEDGRSGEHRIVVPDFSFDGSIFGFCDAAGGQADDENKCR